VTKGRRLDWNLEMAVVLKSHLAACMVFSCHSADVERTPREETRGSKHPNLALFLPSDLLPDVNPAGRWRARVPLKLSLWVSLWEYRIGWIRW
jgi:hypothetical protein